MTEGFTLLAPQNSQSNVKARPFSQCLPKERSLPIHSTHRFISHLKWYISHHPVEWCPQVLPPSYWQKGELGSSDCHACCSPCICEDPQCLQERDQRPMLYGRLVYSWSSTTTFSMKPVCSEGLCEQLYSFSQLSQLWPAPQQSSQRLLCEDEGSVMGPPHKHEGS